MQSSFEAPPGRNGLPTAEQLARRFRQGDPEAIALVRRYVRKVVRSRALGIAAADVEDLEQEAMAQLWRAAAAPGFDTGAGFWGFVEVVTARRCIDFLRRRRLQIALSPEWIDERPGPFRQAALEERLRLAEEAVAAVGEPCGSLLRLRFREGRSFREIAAESGRSRGALRVQLHRCIRRVQRYLAERESGR